MIGQYLSTLQKRDAWSKANYDKIQRKAYGYFLKDGFLWKHPKKTIDLPHRVICKKKMQEELLKEFHESIWAAHRGVWATYMK